MSATTPHRTAELLSGATAAVLATAVFLIWRDGSARWASALPGHLLGIVGLLLMLWATVGYTWRKHRPARGAPAMRSAMQSHIVAGLIGPYLVVLHTGLVFHGLAGVLTLMMVLVVASGVIGRAVITAIPTNVALVDPVRTALLDADLARLETAVADLQRQSAPNEPRLAELRAAIVSVRHEQDLLRSQWRQEGGSVAWRRVFSLWWYLHIPVSTALWVVAIAHVAGTLYYATFAK